MPDSPRKGALAVVFLTVFIDLLGFGIVLPLLPLYAKEFTLDDSGITIGLLMASFSAMQFLFAPIWGRLSDRIGRRPVLMIGLAGSTVSYAVFGLSTSMGSLVGIFMSRIGAGVAGATIPTAQAYIADVTPKEQRARGMALIGAAFGLGFTFGPLLALTAIPAAGETGLSPWPGYTASILSGLALVLAIVKLPESLHAESERGGHRFIDLASLKNALTIPTIGGLLLTSFVGVVSFANFESIFSTLLKTESAQGGFDFSLTNVMLFFAMLGFVHAMAQGAVRGFSRRVSEAKLATAGAIVSIAGFVCLAMAVHGGSLGLLVCGTLVEAAGFAFLPPTLQSLISRRSDPAKQGSILGVGQSLSALARIIGPVVSFPLFALHTAIPFWLGAALMGVALLLIVKNAYHGSDFKPSDSQTRW